MSKFVIGIDGGGSETVLIIADTEGRICSRHIGPACNYQILGTEELRVRLGDFLNESIEDAGIARSAVGHICLGLAGVGRDEDQTKVVKLFESMGWDGRVSAESDALIALEGAFSGGTGIILISGSGAICVGRNKNGEVIRAGGWGYLLGDEGSGFDLGMKALKAALQAFDGRGAETLLLGEITSRFGLGTIDRIVPKVYSGEIDNKKIAAIAPLVFDVAAIGDEVAKEIVTTAAEQLAQLVAAVVRRLHLESQKIRVALSGGVFRRREMLIDRIERSLRSVCPDIEFIAPRFEPAIGAVILALRNIGVSINSRILKSLEATTAH